MGETWYEPATTLGVVAGATERIGLLTHVLILPYRHPLIVAKTYATLDRLSGGRVILGVGSGHAKPEFRILGSPFEQRGILTDEAIQAIRIAWREDVASFEGQCVRFRDVLVFPRPVQAGGPPIWVGGNSRTALRRAARLADGWIPWQLTLESFLAAVAEGERILRELGRTSRFDWIVPIQVERGAESGRLRAEIERWEQAGATGFHLGLQARSAEEFLERLEWFATAVARPVRPTERGS